MNLWINDPRTQEKSVSLTILITSMLVNISAIVLQGMGKIESASAAENFFMVACGLYFGRKFSTSKGDTLEESVKS
jgi:hypothetical protein